MNLFLAPMILVPNITHAYFQIKGEESHYLRDGYKGNFSENENTFALYDNFIPGIIEENQILFPKSKFFVSADLIPIAFPIPITFYIYTTTENALEDLLYANLKMKKFIEDYTDIQERTKELIWNSNHLFQQKNYTGSMYQISKRLKNYSVQTTKELSGALISSSGRLVSNNSHSSRSAFNRSQRLRSNLQLPINRNTMNNNRPDHSHNFEDQDDGNLHDEANWINFFRKRTDRYDDIEKHDEASFNEEENSVTQLKFYKKSYREIPDPIIIKLINKLFDLIPYFIVHKGEAVFCGIGLYLILWFFSSIFFRK